MKNDMALHEQHKQDKLLLYRCFRTLKNSTTRLETLQCAPKPTMLKGAMHDSLDLQVALVSIDALLLYVKPV